MANDIINGARPYEKRTRIPLTGQGFTKTQVRFLDEWGEALETKIRREIYGLLQDEFAKRQPGAVTVINTLSPADVEAFVKANPDAIPSVLTTNADATGLNPADAALAELKPEADKPAPFVATLENTPTATPVMLEMINQYGGELQAGLRRIAAKDAPAASRIPEMKNFIANFRV